MITKEEYWSFPVSKTSMTTALNQTKERCKMALKKKVAYTKNENGEYVYEDCNDEVAEKEIANLIDNIAYHLLEILAQARASENLMIEAIGKKEYFKILSTSKYIFEVEKEKNRTDLGEYNYEPDEDDIEDEDENETNS